MAPEHPLGNQSCAGLSGKDLRSQQNQEQNFEKLFMELAIKSEGDYMEKTPLFAAVPDMVLHFGHSMPWFDHFECTIRENRCR